MANPKSLTIKRDDVKKVMESLKRLTDKALLIGIPEANGARKAVEDQQPISNAALGYIHEFGAPESNIPARPFLIPGVNKAVDPALSILKNGAKASLSGDKGAAELALNRVGVIAVNKVRHEISTGNFAPLKASTIRNRYRSRGTKGPRLSEQLFEYNLDEAMHDYGQSEEDAAYFAQINAGTKPLINSGQLRSSVTFVLRGEVKKKKS